MFRESGYNLDKVWEAKLPDNFITFVNMSVAGGKMITGEATITITLCITDVMQLYIPRKSEIFCGQDRRLKH